MPEYLDPEIANEGVSADEWSPAVPEARIPDYKGIKSIAKYFPQFTGRPYHHLVFPCWLYHPTEPPRKIEDRIVHGEDGPRLDKKASEIAKELGCVYRQTTMDERAQGFPLHRWEYTGKWRATPYHAKFDPANPGTGKQVVTDKNAAPAYPDIATIVATVLEKMGASAAGPVQAPQADPDWGEFQAFKAWKAHSGTQVTAPAPVVNALSNALSEDEEWQLYEEEAKKKGIKIDGRWSVERLKAEVEKAA